MIKSVSPLFLNFWLLQDSVPFDALNPNNSSSVLTESIFPLLKVIVFEVEWSTEKTFSPLLMLNLVKDPL